MRVTATIIREIVSSEDGNACIRLADTMRIEYGFTYGRIWRMVSNVTGISMSAWDALLYEGETP